MEFRPISNEIHKACEVNLASNIYSVTAGRIKELESIHEEALRTGEAIYSVILEPNELTIKHEHNTKISQVTDYDENRKKR